MPILCDVCVVEGDVLGQYARERLKCARRNFSRTENIAFAEVVKAAAGRFCCMSNSHNSIYMFRRSAPHRFAPGGGAFGLSFVLHCSLAFLLFHASNIFYAAPDARFAAATPRKIYYIVPILQASKTLPRIVMRDSGEGDSKPRPAQQPDSKALIFPENLEAVSRPKNPENDRQTILQANAPNIHIKTDLPLPNVIMQMTKGAALESPIDNANARPVQHQARLIDEEAPRIAPQFKESNSSLAVNSQTKLPMPSSAVAAPISRQQSLRSAVLPNMPGISVPDAAANTSAGALTQLPAPSVSAAKPVHAQTTTVEVVEIPAIAGAASIKLEQGNVPVSQTELLIPTGSVAKPTQKTSARVDVGSAPAIAEEASPNTPQVNAFGSQAQLPAPTVMVARPIGTTQKAGSPAGSVSPPNSGDLVIISVNPSAAVSQIVLPPGTRLGVFAITAPSTGKTDAAGARESANSAGKSTALNGEHAGVGGKDSSGTNLTVNTAGSIKPEASGALGPPLPAEMIFPVLSDMTPRKSAMVVATGPIGGGGLGVYGVLNCGKIFTIFLPMPGKNWTMQYCAKPGSSNVPTSGARSVGIQWNDGLVPPEPKSKFDFRRLPVPSDKRNDTIVLKGVLRADGTVAQLEVYRGTTAEMNKAAKIAFSRWKFKPALLHGVPVPVELLIGIPPAQ